MRSHDLKNGKTQGQPSTQQSQKLLFNATQGTKFNEQAARRTHYDTGGLVSAEPEHVSKPVTYHPHPLNVNTN